MGGGDAAAGPVHPTRENVKKLILLLVVFAVASATVPALRDRVEPRVVPVWDTGLLRLEPVIEMAMVPVHRRLAQHGAQSIARMLHSRADASDRLRCPAISRTTCVATGGAVTRAGS